MKGVTLARPWLEFDFGGEMRVLSWSLNTPGFCTARRILWREVRDTDLTPELDVGPWLSAELTRIDATDAVAFLTSRDVTYFSTATATAGAQTARCVATVGLSNAERIGHRIRDPHRNWGTINIAVHLKSALTVAAHIEAISIVAQARTAAVMDIKLPLATGIATGTGTDCIAIAAPITADHGLGEGIAPFAGLHTELGEALGAAVYQAVHSGACDWMRQQKT